MANSKNQNVANELHIAYLDVTIYDVTGSKEIFSTREYVVVDHNDYVSLNDPDMSEDEYCELFEKLLLEPARKHLCVKHGLRLVSIAGQDDMSTIGQYDNMWAIDGYDWMR